MRIVCPFCLHKSIVLSSRRITAAAGEATCLCTDADCAARFVVRIVHSHTLTPPAGTLTDSLHEQLALLPDDERRELLKPYLPR